VATRGLVILKRGNKQKAYYNHWDSYPTELGAELAHKLWLLQIGYDDSVVEKTLHHWLLGRSPGNLGKPRSISGDITKPHRRDIDYLMIEWIYVVDIPKKRWTIYKTVYPASFAFRVADFNFSDPPSPATLEKLEKTAEQKADNWSHRLDLKKPVKVRGHTRTIR